MGNDVCCSKCSVEYGPSIRGRLSVRPFIWLCDFVHLLVECLVSGLVVHDVGI